MKLSIVILNYKSKNLVRYCLRTISDFHFDFQWETIVVDNGSKDGMAKKLAPAFPQVKFKINQKNLGMGGGNNQGIGESSGQYVLIANPDVTLNEQAIKKMIDFLDAKKEAAIVAPRINNPDGGRQETVFRLPKPMTFIFRRTFLGKTKIGKKHLDFYLYHGENLDQARQVDWVLGGCFMSRRKALDTTGIFDQRFFLFLEDTDLCRRMRLNGFEIWYLPEAQVVHLPHRLSAGDGSIMDIFSKMALIHLSSWIKYFWKWRKANL